MRWFWVNWCYLWWILCLICFCGSVWLVEELGVVDFCFVWCDWCWFFVVVFLFLFWCLVWFVDWVSDLVWLCCVVVDFWFYFGWSWWWWVSVCCFFYFCYGFCFIFVGFFELLYVVVFWVWIDVCLGCYCVDICFFFCLVLEVLVGGFVSFEGNFEEGGFVDVLWVILVFGYFGLLMV